MRVYDIHQHIKLEPDYDAAWLARDYERRIRIMDRNGIDKAAISATSRFDVTRGIEDVRRVNDLIATYVSRYADRFPVGFGVVDPRMKEASMKEIHRVIADLGLRGISWHHMSYGTYINDQITFDGLREIQRLGAVTLIHTHAESMWEAAWRVDPLAEAFPDLPMVVVSGLYGWASNDQTLWVARKHKNIMVDAVLFPVNLWIERIVRELGSERVLYGSDLVALPEEMAFHHAASLEEIRASPHLSDTEKGRILADNMKALLALA